jgi:restriction endonuclease
MRLPAFAKDITWAANFLPAAKSMPAERFLDTNVYTKESILSAEVVVYAKLPKTFFIPTPVGNYNPDCAIAFNQAEMKHQFDHRRLARQPQ